MNDLSLAAFESIIGPENVNSAADPPILLPLNEHHLSEIIHRAGSDSVKVISGGRRTFPAPESPDKSIVVSTTAMSSVKEINPDDFIVITQAGAVVDDVVSEAEHKGFLVPLDITSGDVSTVGGALMTGALGPSSAGYGVFRESVIGVRCVSPNGDIITGGGRTAKNVTGYDIPRFLAGTMGLFAIAFELTIKVKPLPESRVIVVARFSGGSKSFHTVKKLAAGIKNMTMLEIIAPEGLGGIVTVAVGLEGMETIVRQSADITRDRLGEAGADNIHEEKRETFMKQRRGASKNMVGNDFLTISVPSSSSDTLMEKIHAYSETMPVIAHPAIGRFHCVSRDEKVIQTLRETSLSVGGKRPLLWGAILHQGISDLFTGAELEIARSLKREFDPQNILNPHLL
ncbi:FAD-binding oxidoreductase [Candidatus Latescibacterota bacterium]